ncbi:MAG: GGDEF domain-containing protein [Chloroflexi bacterium]|nr:GGDEF domain-containing protein [Chloroflexota bacterium]
MAEREFDLARRNEAPFSVIMLDVDGFKKFNDSFGHKVGDQVLIQVAETCKSALRGSDIFGRLGGEEFALAAPATPLEHAVEIAARLRRLIHEQTFRFETGEGELPEPFSVTVSVGVVASDPACKNLDALMERADKAMYLAKNSGRNQVRAWGEE